MKRLAFILVLLSVSLSTKAEYRVYQYLVRAKLKLPQDIKPYLVTSSLDPVSYLAYHGGQEALKLDLLRTWVCPGHTGGYKIHCESPYGQVVENKDFIKLENEVARP